jgi:hypothetical protein
MTVEQYLRFTDDMTPEQKLKKINKSRNYIRYNIIRGWNVDTQHPLLTEAERLYLIQMQDNREAVKQAKIRLLTFFYDNSPEVGSTIKRKPVPKGIEIIAGPDIFEI